MLWPRGRKISGESLRSKKKEKAKAKVEVVDDDDVLEVAKKQADNESADVWQEPGEVLMWAVFRSPVCLSGLCTAKRPNGPAVRGSGGWWTPRDGRSREARSCA